MSGSKFPKGQWLAAWDCANYKQLCKSGKKYHVGLDCFCAQKILDNFQFIKKKY